MGHYYINFSDEKYFMIGYHEVRLGIFATRLTASDYDPRRDSRAFDSWPLIPTWMYVEPLWEG